MARRKSIVPSILIVKVVYELELPQQLTVVHQVFNISMFKKCMGDPLSIIPNEDSRISDNLSYEETSIQILDNEV